MLDVLAWLEASALGHAMRNAGVWIYAVVNLIHLVGVAALFGSLLLLDLRLLGLWARVPVSAIAASAIPVSRVGFSIAAISGLCLITSNATEYNGNPFLLPKFIAIAIGLINVVILHTLPAWTAMLAGMPRPHDARQLAVAAGVSLVCWSAAIACGRMLGYW